MDMTGLELLVSAGASLTGAVAGAAGLGFRIVKLETEAVKTRQEVAEIKAELSALKGAKTPVEVTRESK